MIKVCQIAFTQKLLKSRDHVRTKAVRRSEFLFHDKIWA